MILRRVSGVLAMAMILFAMALLPLSAEPRTANDFFSPAFTADKIDMAQTRTFLNGTAQAADAAKVTRALGLNAPAGNWEEGRWDAGKVTTTDATTFEYLLVLKEPVTVGTMAIDLPDYPDNGGSRNGGELFYLKDSVSGAPNPADAAQWTKLEFVGVQPFLRFGILPAGIKSRAFVYRDIRTAGFSSISHWNFYASRLGNITGQGKGFASGGRSSADPAGLLRGDGWSTASSAPGATKPAPINDKNPGWYILAWDKPQNIGGVFFSSNANAYAVYRFKADATADPAFSTARDWEKIDAAAVRECKHQFQWWYYFTRWVTLPAGATKAIKIEFTTHEGGTGWISGLGSFVDIKDGPAPAAVVRDDRPPFRIAAKLGGEGQSAVVIDTADGRRLKNIMAQTELPKDVSDFAWDLRGPDGKFVAPGKYRLKTITGPLPELIYRNTPYPNVQNYFPEHVPWLTGTGADGWLSDHAQHWASTTLGDRVYFGASIAEAGITFMEMDLNGKKLWGCNNFGAWLGVNSMTADETGKNLYIMATDQKVYRMNPETHEMKVIFQADKREANVERRGWFTAMAARDNKVYLAFAGDVPTFDNPCAQDGLDLDHCSPKPWGGEFQRMLRFGGTPVGQGVDVNSPKPQGNGHTFLESTYGPEDEQYMVIAFRRPVPIGSVVLPHPGAKVKMQISVAKADAPFPPRPGTNADWIPFAYQGQPDRWECLAAPENTLTRALRIKFSRSSGEALSEKQWFERLEGLQMLSRRFKDLALTAKIRVNSGVLSPTGEWDGQRKDAIGEDKPGIYLMEWDTPQKIDGLKIKEIDAARAEIDVWTGAATGTIPLAGTDGWKNVATYHQKRRTADYSGNDNQFARYMDGEVEFREKGALAPQTTRAIRLRIVEPWLDNANGGCQRHDGRSEHGVHISQSYIMQLDTRRCRVLGVIPMQSMSGAPPIDSLITHRVEVHDGTTGKLLRELPTRLGWGGMAFGADGQLYSINGDHHHMVRVNTETGAETTVVPECKPSRATVGPDGNAYVKPWADDGSSPAIQVYSLSTGKFIRTLGHATNLKAGPWDAEAPSNEINSMTVDRDGHLWYPEASNNPRRILEFDTKTGQLLKEMTGCTWYGGGGTLNRYDISRAYYQGIEFEIDYAKNKSKIRSRLSDSYFPADVVALRVKNHMYLVSAALSMNERQSVGYVYLADGDAPVRLVSAFGDANSFGALRTGAIISLLGGKPPKDFNFIWSDKNGNGKVDADEVQFSPKAGSLSLGGFDAQLGCMGTDGRYQPKEFLPDGTPIFERVAVPAWAQNAYLRLNDGNYLIMHGQFKPTDPSENYVVDPTGKELWAYPAHGGMSGLSIPGWTPGNVTNEFCVIGHETDPGALGEFFVTSANDGQWRIWTSDGLLAGQVLLHKFDSRAHFLSMPGIKPGMRVDPLTASQEHFHGFFTKDEATGKYYIITGFTSINVMEVGGLDRFRRSTTDFTVTQADIDHMKAWESQRAQRLIESKPLLLKAKEIDPVDDETPKIDGIRKDKEWGQAAYMGDNNAHSFSMSYDTSKLYLCWTTRGMGPLNNTGTEFQRLFKTGAAADLFLSTNPTADNSRTKPAAGDLRLLITMIGGKSKVVLYQPIAPNAAASEAWRAYTPAGGETAFQRVVELKSAVVGYNGGNDYTLEVSIPLADIGLKPKKGMRVKMDWGLLSTGDGTQVKQRLYWANTQATGTSDEPTEARLEPQFWGFVSF